MAMPNPYQQYQQQSILTASPGELTLMLYNGCIRFIKQAKQAIEKKDIPAASQAILRAQDIIMEFMSTLDMQYEVSDNLMALYDFIHHRLIDANVKKDTAILDEALELVTELRDTWSEAMKVAKTGAGHVG